jgi:ABC-type lipoprotein release transport system permease subunit
MGYEEILDTRIIGIVKSGSNMVNVFGVFISMDTAEYYLQMDGSVTAYAIEVSAGKRGDAQLEELRRRLPEEYRLLGYDEIAADFVAMQEMENSFVYVGIFIHPPSAL